MLAPFEFHEPSSVEEAVRLKRELGDEAAFYAGGTELLMVLKKRLVRYRHLIHLKTIPGLDQVRWDPGTATVHVGPLVTHRTLERSELARRHLPPLAEAAGAIGNVRVRVAGTIGGNLCFAHPHADPPNLLVALGARLRVAGPDGQRWVAADEFVVDYFQTALGPGELLVDIAIPALPREVTWGYYRHVWGHRPVASCAVVLRLAPDGEQVAEAVVSLGCLNPTPVRLPEAERLLQGLPLRQVPRVWDEVARCARAAARPTEDAAGSVDYKRHLSGVVARRALWQALTRRTGADGAVAYLPQAADMG